MNAIQLRQETDYEFKRRMVEMIRDPEGLVSNIVHFHTPKTGGPTSVLGVVKIYSHPDQIDMARLDPLLCTGEEWVAMSMAGRMAIAIAAVLPTGRILGASNMLDILPGSTMSYLAYWQDQVNTGDWCSAPWRVGEIAANLTDSGYLLRPRKRQRNFYGFKIESRYTEDQGKPGTDAFVQKVMGPEYLGWIKEVA